MRKIFAVLFGVSLLFGAVNVLNAEIVTITFENVLGAEDGDELPSDYAGLTWSSGWNLWMPGSGSGWTSSGDYSADPFNNILEISFGQKVTFLGSWVYQYNSCCGYENSWAKWEGWSGDTKIGESDLISGAGWIEVNWNVDKVKFVATNSLLNSIDDIKYNTVILPEPISSALFVTGGILLAGRRYFKRRK